MALEGLRTAISSGDIRAIHLLEWVGLLEKLNVDTLLWALRNAGGDKLATVNHILRLGFTVMSDRDGRRVQKELAELRDEAEQEGDQEKFDFVRDVLNSQTLYGTMDIRL